MSYRCQYCMGELDTMGECMGMNCLSRYPTITTSTLMPVANAEMDMAVLRAENTRLKAEVEAANINIGKLQEHIRRARP